MKVRNVLVLVLLNIFLVMLFSLISEYSDFKYSVQTMRFTVDTATEEAIISATRSEEFFTDNFGSLAITSSGQSIFSESDGSRRNLYVTNSILRDGNWVAGNSYIMAMFYSDRGRLPDSQYEYNSFADGKTVEDIYEYLFGTVGSDYASASLTWANDSPDLGIYDASIRVPNGEFLGFYDSVGKYITEVAYVKERDGADNYKIVEKEYPVLANMGLKLDPYNDVGSLVTSDNFTSVVKEGHNSGNYFLTPYSLGVTYIPRDVFKTMLLCNLENTIRFNACRSDPLNGIQRMNNYAAADGCISTEVYDGGIDSDGRHVASADAIEHSTTSSYIMNDGNVEYDLSTLECKIDYFLVDFYDSSNYRIVNAVDGARLGAQGAGDLSRLPSLLKDSDTKITADTTPEEIEQLGLRVVAKVSVKLKVHIPYKSGVMQWFAHLNSSSTEEHFDVKLWDTGTDSIVETESGVWYTYTTFYTISR